MSDKGIFATSPVALNIKCVIFALIIIIIYVISSKVGKVNLWIIPLIFLVAYVLLAWYDKLYNCSDRLYSGKSGVIAMMDSIFKPQDIKNTPENNPKNRKLLSSQDQQKTYNKYVNLFHVFIISIILIYVGIKKNKTPQGMYALLLGLGIVSISYHGMRLFYPRKTPC